MRTNLGRFLTSLAAASLFPCLFVPATVSGATFNFVNLDDPNEGFNDPTSVSPVGGNPGTTLGAQRQNAFMEAAQFWGDRLQSNVTINVEGEMSAMSCTTTSAVLGAAGPNSVSRDFPGAPLSSTWYHAALANSLNGSDLSGSNDIGSEFNKAIDEDPNCLSGVTWYYGFDDAPSGTISFIDVVLHEIAHGLGVSTFVNLSTGSRFFGFNDIYMTFLEDHSLATNWPSLSDGQRATSATDTGDLHWTGTNVRNASGVLSNGTVGDHVRMYAPNPLQSGSSVSHWDTVLKGSNGVDDELMEPILTDDVAVLVTDEMFVDEGWTLIPCGLADTLNLANDTITTTEVFEACSKITAGNDGSGDFVVGSTGNLTLRAGQSVVLTDGFSVESGGKLTIEIDPTIN